MWKSEWAYEGALEKNTMRYGSLSGVMHDYLPVRNLVAGEAAYMLWVTKAMRTRELVTSGLRAIIRDWRSLVYERTLQDHRGLTGRMDS